MKITITLSDHATVGELLTYLTAQGVSALVEPSNGDQVMPTGHDETPAIPEWMAHNALEALRQATEPFSWDEARDPYSAASNRIVRTTPCTYCGQPAGNPCTTPKLEVAQFTHADRIRDSR